jgi:F-type H+-transporting ATPase subunit b
MQHLSMRSLLIRTRSIVLAAMVVLWFSLTARGAVVAPEQHTARSGEPAAAAAHGEHADGEHGGESQSPLPDPTNSATYTSALWVVIIFVVLLAVLYPTAWKQVLAGLKAREQRIRTDIAEAEAARAKAEATLREYNSQLAAAESRVRDMLTKAQADGEKLATTIRMQAQQEAEEAKERANRDIEASKNAALVEIRNETAELATSIASKILRRNLNTDDQRELVRESLEQLQSVKA